MRMLYNAVLFINTSQILDTIKLIHLLGHHIWRQLLIKFIEICLFKPFPNHTNIF